MMLLRAAVVSLMFFSGSIASPGLYVCAFAQDREQVEQDTSWVEERIDDLQDVLDRDEAEPVEGVETLRLAPLVGGIQSGAGITVGIRFIPVRSEHLFTAVDLRGSHRKYYSVGAQLGYEWGSFLLHGFGRYRHMPEENFFGIGPDVSDDDETDYRLNDLITGAQLGYIVADDLLAGVHASYLANYLGSGKDDDEPDIEDIFDPVEVPGFGVDTRYGLFGAWLQYDTRDLDYSTAFGSRLAPTSPRIRNISFTATRGLYGTAEVRRYSQVDGDGFSFTEGEVELQQYLPLSGGKHVIAFREYGLFTTPDEDDEVPFYLLPTLGGSRTLRGYETFQFRDQNALLANIEYRWNGWPYIQPAVFFDAGNVFPGFSDIEIEDTKVNVGAALRLIIRSRAVFRAEAAYGEEGIRAYVRLGFYR